MKKNIHLFILAFILGLGLAVRLIDITDLPLDFHPTRQLHSAIIARSIYAEMSNNYDPELQNIDKYISKIIYRFEPSILESIVVFFYLLFGEILWIPRLINIVIWVSGAIITYQISKLLIEKSEYSEIIALFTPAAYLFLPLGILTSRSFQPDPLMVVLTMTSLYGCISFINRKGWKFIFLASISGAFAIFIKGFAIYFIGPLFLVTLLNIYPLNNIGKTIRDFKVWIIVTILTIPIIYYLFGSTFKSGNYFLEWFFSVSGLLITVKFYAVWLEFLQTNFSFWFLFFALIGVFSLEKKYRDVLISIWVGYFLYCFSVPHQTMTHDYYHLILVPLVAISACPIIETVYVVARKFSVFYKVIIIIGLLVVVILQLWQVGTDFLEVDYRDRQEYWEYVASCLPPETSIVALTEDYGYPLAYWGRRTVNLWPDLGEIYLAEIRNNSIENFEDYFNKKTMGAELFLVTNIEDFNQQKELNDYLFLNYELIHSDPYCIIFLLN